MLVLIIMRLFLVLFVTNECAAIVEADDLINILLNKNTTNRRLNKIYKNFNTLSLLMKNSEILNEKLVECELNFNIMISNETKRQEEQFRFGTSLRFYQYMTNLQSQIFNFFK